MERALKTIQEFEGKGNVQDREIYGRLTFATNDETSLDIFQTFVEDPPDIGTKSFFFFFC